MSDKYCMVISNGVFLNGSDVFNILDADTGGRDTFSVKLSNDGGVTLTHWAAYSTLAPDVLNALTNMTVTQFKAFVDAEAVRKERQPAGSITAFKNNIQISAANASPWAYVASLGLVRMPVTM